MSIRREALYLRDILDAAGSIRRFLNDVDRSQFLSDELLQSGVLQKLIVIAEAAANIPTDLRNRYPDVPWTQIVGFRHIAVHAYFSVDWEIVWVAASEETPSLASRISEIVTVEFPDLRLHDSEDSPSP